MVTSEKHTGPKNRYSARIMYAIDIYIEVERS
jgi:hypothetical protein